MVRSTARSRRLPLNLPRNVAVLELRHMAQVGEGQIVASNWTFSGTHSGGLYLGMEPNGAQRVDSRTKCALDPVARSVAQMSLVRRRSE